MPLWMFWFWLRCSLRICHHVLVPAFCRHNTGALNLGFWIYSATLTWLWAELPCCITALVIVRWRCEAAGELPAAKCATVDKSSTYCAGSTRNLTILKGGVSCGPMTQAVWRVPARARGGKLVSREAGCAKRGPLCEFIYCTCVLPQRERIFDSKTEHPKLRQYYCYF